MSTIIERGKALGYDNPHELEEFDGWTLVRMDTRLRRNMALVAYGPYKEAYKGRYNTPALGVNAVNNNIRYHGEGVLMTDVYSRTTLAWFALYAPAMSTVSKKPPMPMNKVHSEPLPLP